MNRIGIMTRKVNSYRIGKQVRILALAALFLAPFWTWGQTSTQNGRKQGRGVLGLLLLAVFAFFLNEKVWAQTDYSGVYYIANKIYNNQHNNSTYWYNNLPQNERWYLVPAANPQQTNKEDAYYSKDAYATPGDSVKPFLTTYQTNCDTNSIWIVKKTNSKYYIIHAATGKYVKYEPPISTNLNRRSVHLDTVNNNAPGNVFQFTITTKTEDSISGYNIKPTLENGNDAPGYLNPAGENWPYYYAHMKNNQGIWCTGLVGYYNNQGGGSLWPWEDAKEALKPIIQNVAAGKYTLSFPFTMPSSYTIHYTIDPTVIPGSNTGETYTLGYEIPITQTCTLRAWVVAFDMVISGIAEQTVYAEILPPTFEVLCDNELQISCDVPNADIYYAIGNDNPLPPPDGNGILYEDPIVGLSDGAIVYAITYLNGDHSVVANYPYPTNNVPPTVTLEGSQAKVEFLSGQTIHYTIDGSDPDPNDAGESTSPYYITGLSYDVDVNICVITTSTDGRGASCPVTIVKRPKWPTLDPSNECVGTTRIHTFTFTDAEPDKTYWYALSNGSGQTAPDLSTFMEYLGSPVNIAAIPAWNGTSLWVTLHAYAKDASNNISAVASQNYRLKTTEVPTITQSGNVVTISATTGATIHYSINGVAQTNATTSTTVTISEGLSYIITASAKFGEENESCEVMKIVRSSVLISSLDSIVDPYGAYELNADVDATGYSTFNGVFHGSLNGNYHTISNLSVPLFDVMDDAMLKNLVLENVVIPSSTSTNVGALTNVAKGATQIYNCGILDGSIVGGTNVGGLVGLIQENSSVRVVNCYNYANVSGSSYAAGIVGKNEGTVAADGTVGNVRIALCMMYGSVSGATNISPVYCGNHVGNVQNYTEYNFYLYSNERDDDGNKIEKIPYTVYNDQQAITEEEYLTRFPFHRHILNTHRELGAFFLFGASTSSDVNSITLDEISEIGHWVLKPDEADYPIVEPWLTNKTNTTPTYEHNNLPNTTEDYKGRLLTEMGNNGYLNVSISIDEHSYSASLPITDMNTDRHDYTWGKVVLPFANEFEINTDYDRICTGWKITSVTKEGTAYSSYSATNYNFADRDNPQKDIYGGDNLFIFAQGGYYIVPYGVTAITIEANFANAIYLSDATYDVGYSTEYDGPTGLGGNVYANTEGKFHGKTVHHNIKDALIAAGETNTPHTQAIVLVGNYHFPSTDNTGGNDYLDTYKLKAFTLMSIDADNNQEPDYAFYSKSWLNRPKVPPMRIDFVALVPVGMAAHVKDSKYYPGLPIWNTRGWFEMTETSLSWANQFELGSSQFNLDPATSTEAKKYNRLIINSGYFVQMVRASKTNRQGNDPGCDCDRLIYSQIGGNTYIKEYYPGSHSANPKTTTLVPVNVTGGEIEQCFMTGYGYKESSGYGTAVGDNIYFWCAGGKIGKFLGAYMENPVPATTGKVNMTANIDHALITEFYGGGTSPEARITGKIDVTIKNSRVDRYCGGPEFGDMTSGETVTTTATNTTFGYFYGAGFGGTGITYYTYEDYTQPINDPNSYTTTSYPSGYFATHYSSTSSDHGRLKVKNGGIGTCYKFEYIVNTSVLDRLVARFYTGFAKFDLATTGNVTNTLTDCTVLYDFFGGGCQGKVDGTVTSTLANCTVYGNAFGAGYKATANDVEVYPTTDPKNPPYSLSKFTMATGIFSEFHIPDPVIFQWKQGTAGTSSDTNKELYTDKPMSTLGDVTGKVTITLKGKTTVMGSVFGGGYESKSLSDTEVQILDRTRVFGNIYGGGNMGTVGGDTKVIINGTVPDETPTGNANNNNPNH